MLDRLINIIDFKKQNRPVFMGGPSHEHGTILFFEVDDVDETVEHVKQENIPVWREPFSIGHSPERMAIVGDSEGNAIGIMSF